MSSHTDKLNRLLDGEDLAQDEAFELMHAMAASDLDPVQAGAFLAALRAKGETAEEIRGFAVAMRELALKPALAEGSPTVDTVGTGGDGSGSLNLSTGTGLLAAACGRAGRQAWQSFPCRARAAARTCWSSSA